MPIIIILGLVFSYLVFLYDVYFGVQKRTPKVGGEAFFYTGKVGLLICPLIEIIFIVLLLIADYTNSFTGVQGYGILAAFYPLIMFIGIIISYIMYVVSSTYR